MTLPLLIGGATTSRAHTAVKLEPAYSGPVVHVDDASRAVGVAAALLDPVGRDAFVQRVRAEYAEARRIHEGRSSTRSARPAGGGARQAAAHRLGRRGCTRPVRPSFLGVRAFADHPIADLVERIDWTPFFSTWELRGRYPDILSDPAVGAAARELFDDAQAMLARIVAGAPAAGRRGGGVLARRIDPRR